MATVKRRARRAAERRPARIILAGLCAGLLAAAAASCGDQSQPAVPAPNTPTPTPAPAAVISPQVESERADTQAPTATPARTVPTPTVSPTPVPIALPTQTPTPSPTRTPTPTPTATPGPSSYLRHIENWLWLQQQDPILASSIVDLDWVRDGVDAGESSVIENLLYIAVVSRQAAASIVDLPWMRDGPDEPEARAIGWLSNIDDADLAHLFIALDWVQDGVDGAEAGAIGNLSAIADEDAKDGMSFIALGWIRDGLDVTESSMVNLIASSLGRDFALGLIDFDWVRDGIGQGEVEAVRYLSRIAGQDAALGLSIASMGWFSDGLNDLEEDALDWVGNYTSPQVASSVVALGWVRDGIEVPEPAAIEHLSYISNLDASLAQSLASLPWMSDGISDMEAVAIENLYYIAYDDPQALAALIALGWVRDGIGTLENDALEWIVNYASPQVASSIVAIGWVRDGIEAPEPAAIEHLSYISNLDASLAQSLASLPWISDGISDTEAMAIENLYYIAYDDPQALAALIALGWVRDGIGTLENDALEWIVNIQGAEIASALVALDWIVDGIADPEHRGIEEISYLSYDHPEQTLSLLGMQFLRSVEAPDLSALTALSDLAGLKPGAFGTVMAHPAIRSGITDDMSPIVATLHGVADTNPGLIPVLLAPGGASMERRTVSLPLPTGYAGLLYEDAVLGGFAGTNFGTHMAILPEYDVDEGGHEAEFAVQIIAHEVAHYYWNRSSEWIDEGLAEFMASVADGTRAARPLDVLNPPCAHASSIAELEDLAPPADADTFVCNYSLGERLFADLSRALGGPVFQEGLRRLYLLSEVEDGADEFPGTSLGIEHVRQAFGSEAGATGIVIARWYEGTEPHDASGLDDGPVTGDLPGIDGRIDGAYVSLASEERARASFSLSEPADWINLSLEYSYRLSGAPREMPLQIVEFYEDGFAFRRTMTELVAMEQYIGGTDRFTVGLPPGEWSTGRYTIYVYAGDRKIAEVKYDVTR